MDGGFIGEAALEAPVRAPSPLRRKARRPAYADRAPGLLGCIELHEGQMFDLLRPDPELMTPGNLAQGLANGCRFAGQLGLFYSVAQHSVLMAALAPRDLAAQRAALIHDGDEAFGLPDLASPIKGAFPDYVAAQKRQAICLEARYGVTEEDHRRIKPADHLAFVTEKDAFKSRGNATDWTGWMKDAAPVGWVELEPLAPEAAARLFRKAFTRVFVQGLAITPAWLMRQQGFARGADPLPR